MLGVGVSYPWAREREMVARGSFGSQAPAVERELRGLAHEVTDEMLERDKAGYRGIFLAQLQGILERCDDGNPDDPRWDELRLRALDRLAKLTRIYESEAPVSKQGPGDPRILAGQAAAALAELEASLAETRSA
jgi:hypothetical protein